MLFRLSVPDTEDMDACSEELSDQVLAIVAGIRRLKATEASEDEAEVFRRMRQVNTDEVTMRLVRKGDDLYVELL